MKHGVEMEQVLSSLFLCFSLFCAGLNLINYLNVKLDTSQSHDGCVLGYLNVWIF